MLMRYLKKKNILKVILQNQRILEDVFVFKLNILFF